jgi:spore germination protein GerM
MTFFSPHWIPINTHKPMKKFITTTICFALVFAGAEANRQAFAFTPKLQAATTRTIRVYLVAMNDRGRSGRRIGCDDSLVSVRRTVSATAAPLRAAIQELLAMPEENTFAGRQLHNFWSSARADSLRLESVTISRGVATIRFSGAVPVAGICDEPRIISQIEATARQFPTVRRVRVFLGGVPLRQAVS